ncbi:tryptophan halogenase family protein [Asticcacaulis machinosus]|uniref:Tryptophan 7-halogenase n=1 Tax=Asticcacaulis machinosus TaxID=2984211 RepID=A0ABT5HI50_9CAUL|nr:tryptophan halogenase family protein [Asticcacaulis machinosus]MDC7675919.1 tryptophan 7-halogenase [Asticcacaulis machinosus]
MSGEHIKHIVIVGGGAAGWISASTLSSALRGTVRITLIESDEIGIVGVGEASIPPIRNFNRVNGIDELEFIKRTQATFKLGIEFRNWDKGGDAYIHPFGPYGRSIDLIPFHQYYLRLRQTGMALPLEDYSLAIRAAKQNRFATPQPNVGTVYEGYTYAYHFDAGLYARFLRDVSEARGVHRVEGKITGVNLNPEDGYIDSVTLQSGQTIQGDFFVDCSGFRGLLIEEALKTGYEDWSKYLPCNRALAVPSERVEPLTPYTRATAHQAGWQWRIPLQHRTGNGHVFCDAFTTEDEARSVLLSNLDSKALADPRLLKFTTGRRNKFWNKNCVSIGLASGFMEPLESTSIHLVQTAISRVVGFLPTHRYDEASVDEYNRLTTMEFEETRDFLILHYKANTKPDMPFWQYCRDMPIPDTLQRRIDIFKARGRIHFRHEELFQEASYLAVFTGQNIWPEGYDPVVNVLSLEDTRARLEKMHDIIGQAAAVWPTQTEFIEKTCKAAQIVNV